MKKATLKIDDNPTQTISKRFGVYEKDWDYSGYINSLSYDRRITLSNGKEVLIRFKSAFRIVDNPKLVGLLLILIAIIYILVSG